MLDKQSIKMLSTFLLEVLDFNNIQILDSIIFISSNLLLSKVMRRIINQTNIQNKEILAIIEEAKMEWIYGIKESKKLLEKIHKCNFNGEFELDNYGVIVWYLSENIWLEIVKGGHGGDDLIIVKFKDPTGKVHQDFDCLLTNTDEELIEELKKFDDGKFTVTQKKGWFKNKYKFNYRNWC